MVSYAAVHHRRELFVCWFVQSTPPRSQQEAVMTELEGGKMEKIQGNGGQTHSTIVHLRFEYEKRKSCAHSFNVQKIS